MYKNQLQELAQRSCYNMPSYSCIKEGPDHAPRFKAQVNFNGEVFESPGYFANLRLAEHAAAEAALKDLQTRSSPLSISKILDESGVCKNLLQENAQRAGVPLPVYSTRKSGPGHQPVFTCTVEVAAMQFTGEAAKTKKQAEKNAALEAWTSLRKKAGRQNGAPVEDSDVTDEQEQKLIADILKQNLSERQPIKSSPAALAENHHHRAGISPALLPSTPLYTRRSAPTDSQPFNNNRAPVQPNMAGAMPDSSGPVYQRRTGNDRSVSSGTGVTPAASATGPMYRPRHVNASWVRQQQHGQGGVPPGNGVVGGRPDIRQDNFANGSSYQPRQVHSSPHLHSHGLMPSRSGNSVPHPDAARANHSMPSFPTQPLLSHTLPSVPGMGMPRSSQPHQGPTGTSTHTGISIRPGMAYQPRFVRPQPSYQPTHSSPAPLPTQDLDPSWAPDVQALDARMQMHSSMWSDGSSWNAATTSTMSVRGSVGSQLSLGVPAVMATGGGRVQGYGGVEEDDEAPDSQQVEHTTRLMINHLCLE